MMSVVNLVRNLCAELDRKFFLSSYNSRVLAACCSSDSKEINKNQVVGQNCDSGVRKYSFALLSGLFFGQFGGQESR